MINLQSAVSITEHFIEHLSIFSTFSSCDNLYCTMRVGTLKTSCNFHFLQQNSRHILHPPVPLSKLFVKNM